MAAEMIIEEESGRYTGRVVHPHNGYYAGDFFADVRGGSRAATAAHSVVTT
jgi:hypothetical protein